MIWIVRLNQWYYFTTFLLTTFIVIFHWAACRLSMKVSIHSWPGNRRTDQMRLLICLCLLIICLWWPGGQLWFCRMTTQYRCALCQSNFSNFSNNYTIHKYQLPSNRSCSLWPGALTHNECRDQWKSWRSPVFIVGILMVIILMVISLKISLGIIFSSALARLFIGC